MEKAAAKVYGNYKLLDGGSTEEGLRDLTGCQTEYNQWGQDEEEEVDVDDMWEKIQEYDERGFLIVAGTPGFDSYSETGARPNSGGLTGGHAYSVIRAAEYEGHRLLNIRNPWGRTKEGQGSGEWTGDWSDQSELWDEVDGIKEELEPVFDQHDGNFWMAIEDFVTHFNDIGVCRVEPQFECRLKGKFLKV